MWFLLVLTLGSAPRCAVDVRPHVSQAPLRFIRTRVTIEPDDPTVESSQATREARLALVNEGGEVTSSGLSIGPRTREVEWKNVVLGPGEYEVVLQVFNRAGERSCTARGRVLVAGGQ